MSDYEHVHFSVVAKMAAVGTQLTFKELGALLDCVLSLPEDVQFLLDQRARVKEMA